MTTMKLEERALLVTLTMGQWSASKADREVSREVTEKKKARADSGTFRKQLISRAALKKIGQVCTAARTSHNTLTLPWNDDGSRIITTETYQHYSKVMRDYRIAMQNAVNEFLDGYDDLVKKAREDLGDLFNKDDYPDKSTISSKFYFDVEPRPIPTGTDFRAKVSNAEAKAIAKDIEQRTNARLEEAMKDIWQRVATVTERMFKKLEDYTPRVGLHDSEGVFRDSLVENIKELAELMPSLNVTNDPAINKVQKDLLDNLCKYDPKDLRTDAKARAVTAKKAKDIYNKVSAYLA